MAEGHLVAADAADFQIATDLGRKAGRDVAAAIIRTVSLAETNYQREVIALSGAVAAIACAGSAIREGSAPEATDRDVIEALVEMMSNAEGAPDNG